MQSTQADTHTEQECRVYKQTHTQSKDAEYTSRHTHTQSKDAEYTSRHTHRARMQSTQADTQSKDAVLSAEYKGLKKTKEPLRRVERTVHRAHAWAGIIPSVVTVRVS